MNSKQAAVVAALLLVGLLAAGYLTRGSGKESAAEKRVAAASAERDAFAAEVQALEQRTLQLEAQLASSEAKVQELQTALAEVPTLAPEALDDTQPKAALPAWLSELEGKLDPGQVEALASFLEQQAEELAASTKPDPKVPLRYAHAKLLDLRRTKATEEQLRVLLRPAQLEGYLKSVGGDPFHSGLGPKTDRLTCPGRTVPKLSKAIALAWRAQYRLRRAVRPQVESAARSLALGVVEVRPVAHHLDAVTHRQQVLRRMEQLLVLQADAEQQMLSSLPVSGKERKALFSRQCPIFEFNDL